MVSVVGATFGKGIAVGPIATGIEQLAIAPVAGDAIALQIIDMPGEWCRREANALVTNDPRLDHDPALSDRAAEAMGRDASARMATGAFGFSTARKAGVARTLGDLLDLADQRAGGFARDPASIADAARANPEVIFAHWNMSLWMPAIRKVRGNPSFPESEASN